MSQPDERVFRRSRAALDMPVESAAGSAPGAAQPSKTRLKAQMHALQDLGEALVALEPKRLTELTAEVSLPDSLVEAICEARTITAWGGRKRQLQYIGKLMRDIDPEPIRKRLELLAHGRSAGAARQHTLEQWRDRLIADPATLDRLSAEFPRLDRPRFRALIQKAREERGRGGAPHAFRELFRELKALDSVR